MRYAIPTVDGKLCMHFGHCRQFTLIDVLADGIASMKEVIPPPHEPGLLPDWLASFQVDVVIAGGMGMRARQLLEMKKIEVIVGAPAESPRQLVLQHVKGTLAGGENVCDH